MDLSSLTVPLPLVFPNQIERGLNLDWNTCTLEQAVQHCTIDAPEDTPFIIWLFENPRSPIALPGKIDLYGHDCIHALLDRRHSLADEAFVMGFTMGNDTQTHWLHQMVFKLISSIVYPKKYRFSWKDFRHFDAGFIYGRSIPVRNLNHMGFYAYRNHTVSQVRQQLGVSNGKCNEIIQN